jgi:hypothetical protein
VALLTSKRRAFRRRAPLDDPVLFMRSSSEVEREPDLRATGQDIVFEPVQAAASFVIGIEEPVADLQ